MGRGKIEIKRIENANNRQVTYSKRRNGIIKKAKEITVLCDAEVSLVIMASSGKIHEYSSPSTSLVQILEKYHRLSGKRLWDAKHENLSNEIDRIKKENDNMQIELRHLNGEDINSLTYKELMGIEDTLETGLSSIRSKKMEIWRMMDESNAILEGKNQQLSYILQQHEMAAAMNAEAKDEANGYHQRVRDCQTQMPFPFRLQPMQPNLQERF